MNKKNPNNIVEINDLIEIEDYTNKENFIFTIKESHTNYKPKLGAGCTQNKIIYIKQIESPSDLDKHIISSDSLLAKAILGKKINSLYQYKVDNVIFNGKIINSISYNS